MVKEKEMKIMARTVNLPVLGEEMMVNIIDGESAAQLAIAYQKRNVVRDKLVLYGGSLSINGHFTVIFFEPKTFTEDKRAAITEWFREQGGSAYFVYR